MSDRKKIVLLCVDDVFSRTLYHQVNADYEIDHIIVENHQSASRLLRRRIKKIGFMKVLSQVLFRLLKVPGLQKKSAKRVEELTGKYHFNDSPFPAGKTTFLETVNSEEARNLLREHAPDLVLVNGTRIISGKTIESVAAPFVNIHVGITPKYRGVHGGYWAIKNNDAAHFGVTVHYIDTGVDTGDVIAQKVIEVSEEDNYASYPYLQFGEGVRLLQQKMPALLAGDPVIQQPITKESSIWSHPGTW